MEKLENKIEFSNMKDFISGCNISTKRKYKNQQRIDGYKQRPSVKKGSSDISNYISAEVIEKAAAANSLETLSKSCLQNAGRKRDSW